MVLLDERKMKMIYSNQNAVTYKHPVKFCPGGRKCSCSGQPYGKELKRKEHKLSRRNMKLELRAEMVDD
jgi:hypothetical protein